jgi:hypothetical protein
MPAALRDSGQRADLVIVMPAVAAWGGTALIANVYIDGFNLYYGCLKGTPYKWLDPAALTRRLLPADEIKRIRYFTARVNPRFTDPRAPQRKRRGPPLGRASHPLAEAPGAVTSGYPMPPAAAAPPVRVMLVLDQRWWPVGR